MRPLYPFVGNLFQFESAGSSLAKNLNFRVFLPGNLKLYKVGLTGMAQYTLGWAHDDGSAVNQYDWRSEWARAFNDARHRMQSSLNVTLPWQTSISFLMFANSGRPYSITTGRDENGDQTTNDRPAGYGRNSATGPGSYNIDAQFTKTITLGKLFPSRAGNNALPQLLRLYPLEGQHPLALASALFYRRETFSTTHNCVAIAASLRPRFSESPPVRLPAAICLQD